MQQPIRGVLVLALASAACWVKAAEPTIFEDVGGPATAGSTTVTNDPVTGGKVFVVQGGGTDIWGTGDQFHYAYFNATGDFDYVVRVESLTGCAGDGGWAKAELMARRDTGEGYPEANDPLIANMTTRPSSDTPAGGSAGVNFRGPQWRANRGGNMSWTQPNPMYPPNMPNNWMRIERIGSVFYMYTGNDGVTWNMYNPYSPQGWDTAGSWPAGADNAGESVFTEAWPDTILLGLAVTAHSSGAGETATAVFKDWKAYTPIPIAITTQPPATVDISANSTLTLSVVATGDPIHYQWRKDGVPVATNGLGATYTIPLVALTDAGSYTVRCYRSGQEVISTPAVVTVTIDDTPPTISKATADTTFTAVIVTYSEPMGASAATAGNYAMDQGINVTAAAALDPYRIKLTTSKMAEGATYTLTVNNVQDTALNTIAANTTATVKSFIAMTGWASYQRFADGGDIAAFRTAVDGGTLGAPTVDSAVNRFECPWGVADNYWGRAFCYFTPPTSGNYVFFTDSDDQSYLFLSTDENPANKCLIARETSWSNQYQFTESGGGSTLEDKRSDLFFNSGYAEWPDYAITLTGGQKYYMEVLMDEGGGGDGATITFIKEGDPDPANSADGMFMKGSVISTYLDPSGASIEITQQPQPVDTVANATATFSVVANATNTLYAVGGTYQWQKTTAGGTEFTDIAGATGTSYTTPALTLANNNEQYRVVVSAVPISQASDAALLTVVTDDIKPTIAEVTSDDTFVKVNVKFSEPVTAPSATTAANFTLDGGVTVSGAALSTDGYTVTLTTSKLTDGANYVLTVNNVADRAGNAIVANTTVPFQAWIWTLGKAKYTYWTDIQGTAVADLTGNANYPNNPSGFRFLDEFYALDWVPATDTFGAVVSGWVLPATTGDYVFFCCSDDGGELWLSTDDTPANKKLIAQETGWSGSKNWTGMGGGSVVADKRSDTFANSQWPTPNTINLTAGNRYYIEYIYKEGGGGDNGGATWKLAADADPLAGTSALVGDVIGTYVPPVTSAPTMSAGTDTTGKVVLTFEGTLQSADEAAGPYTDEAATSPATIDPTGAKKFYRAKQ